ncbi:MAG: arginine--tRNA ligase, partial [Roseomonas sp.]|nr:arginine--tRNA ligase [Roseomonas sp.]
MTENVFTAMAEQVRAALMALFPELPADILARVQVEPPRDAAHGDMATNAALVIAKPARLPPAKIAAALVEKLAALPMVEAAEAAGPGFVNLRLRETYLAGQITLMLGAGEAYGDSAIGTGRRVNVEYVSANP